jgi:chromosome segregation ATPase
VAEIILFTLLQLKYCRCETIKQEYDRLLNHKTIEINKLQHQIDEMSNQLSHQKESTHKELDKKDMELKTLQLNFENSKKELENYKNELNQTKTRFETYKIKEKESNSSREKSLHTLEKENEKLNNKCLDLSKEMSDWQRKYETTHSQLNKYEQLIDNLNEQLITLKRECKESQLNLNQVTQNFEADRDAKTKLEAKCQELEKRNEEFKQLASKHDNCEKIFANIQCKYKQIQQLLSSK